MPSTSNGKIGPVVRGFQGPDGNVKAEVQKPEKVEKAKAPKKEKEVKK